MIYYKDKAFCTAKCANIKCHRMISYSQMRHAEKLGLPVYFDDLSTGCKEYIPLEEEKEAKPVQG